MSIEFDWNFGPVDVIDEGDNASVAKVIHWQCVGTDTVNEVDPVRHIGTISLGEPGEAFEAMIAYGEEGCHEQRLAWVNAADQNLVADTEATIEANLSERVIAAAANKQTVA